MLSTLALLCGLYLMALVSPGPNFFIITQLSLTGRRDLALLVAAGIVTGSVTWTGLALFGVAGLLVRVGWLFLALKMLGAAYLAWFGVKLLVGAWRPAESALHATGIATPGQAWRTGLLTSLTNPKAGIFFTSIFASVLPHDPSLLLCLICMAAIAGLSMSWHFGIALLFTQARVQAGYRRLRRPLDAACGTLLVGFGAALAFRH